MTLALIPMAAPRAYPPRITAFTQTFWQGLAQGHWQTTRCQHCQQATFPPKPVCPHCWSQAMAWQPMASQGTLYSWTRVHAAPTAFDPETPYTLAIIDLDDGLRIAMRVLMTPNDQPVIGGRMEVVTQCHPDGPLFAARPVSGHS